MLTNDEDDNDDDLNALVELLNQIYRTGIPEICLRFYIKIICVLRIHLLKVFFIIIRMYREYSGASTYERPYFKNFDL